MEVQVILELIPDRHPGSVDPLHGISRLEPLGNYKQTGGQNLTPTNKIRTLLNIFIMRKNSDNSSGYFRTA